MPEEGASQSTRGGVIRDVAVLDLTASRRPEELRHITRVEHVAVVLVRESAASALTGIDMHGVANVVVVPGDGHVRVHTGTFVTSGEGLAEVGAEQDMLVVTGTLLITTPVARVGYRGLVVTGSVVAPEGSETALANGLTRLTGTIIYFPYRQGQRIETRSGNVEMRGRALANQGGSSDDLLLVTGLLTVTGEVPTVGYERVVVAGVLAAPRASQDELEPIVVATSTFWYTWTPKLLNGSQTLSRGFFELLDEPASLLLNGSFEIDDDVPLELAKEKVAEVALNGSLRAPKGLVGLFQVRTIALNGTISETGPLNETGTDREGDAADDEA